MTDRKSIEALARALDKTGAEAHRRGWPEQGWTLIWLASALKDAVLSKPAAETEAEELRAQLAAAAPLFEAAHKSEATGRYGGAVRGLWDAGMAWARSEAGQRWKAERK